MKRVLTLAVLSLLMIPCLMQAARRRSAGWKYPVMVGARLSTNVVPTEEILDPLTASGELLVNLFRNLVWLRTDPISLTVQENSNYLGINMGSPLDVMYMGTYGDWRPYGFGGFGIGVSVADENISSNARINLGAGAGYEISRALHLYGEAGLNLTNTLLSTPEDSDSDWDLAIFAGIGVRFGLYWK